MEQVELLGHWPLTADGRDVSGHDCAATAHHVACDTVAGRPAARFDGRTSFLEVPSPPTLGDNPFALTAWLHTDECCDDVIGDIACCFDRTQRKGLNLSVVGHAGVCSAQSNYRHIQFGIDDGGPSACWQDEGRPGAATHIFALTVHEGSLYAGTFEIEEAGLGHVWRYEGPNRWTDLGSPDASNSVTSLASFDGELYAATGWYNSCGSLLPPPGNNEPGARVFVHVGDDRWRYCGQLPDSEGAYALTVFNGHLYATGNRLRVYRYEGGEDWVCVNLNQRVFSLAPYHGDLYAMTSGADGIWRYQGGLRWQQVGQIPDITQYYSTVIYEGDLHVGTWPDGRVHRFDGVDQWIDTGRLGQEKEVMGMNIYNGMLYGGTLPAGEVYRYDGPDNWTNMGQVDTTEHVFYRRAWSMAVYRGRLFVGTLPSGHVRSMAAGQCVSYDHELGTGWRHVAALRHGGRLALYVDGVKVAESASDSALDVSNDRPLWIGRGMHDFFSGALVDIRLYHGALNDQDVKQIASS